MASYVPPTTKNFCNQQYEYQEWVEKIFEGNGDLSRYISSEAGNDMCLLNEQDNDEWNETEGLEEPAVLNFFEKFNQKYGEDTPITFQFCCLRQAIKYSCFAPEDERKALLLYLHKDNDKFSEMVCDEFANNSDLQCILEVAFSILPWDLKTDTRGALQKAIEKWPMLDVIKQHIYTEQSALFILLAIGDTVIISSKLAGVNTKKDLFTTIECTANIICSGYATPMDDADSVNSNGRIGAKELQQNMCDNLGNRDYDSYKGDESDQLKAKIGFSKFGAPTEEEGYNEKQKKDIEDTYQAIITQSNKYSEYHDSVTMAILFNCIKPLPDEVKKRKKKYNDYDEYTDIMPVAVYVIRKCFDSQKPCRIIIDHDNRVYQSWSEYIELNKLHKCVMVFPTNGHYENVNGEVSLETRESPACAIDQVILQGTDIAATTVGVGTAVFFGVAAIPAITIAPVALLTASVAGAGVGIYSMVRSSMTLHDRRMRCQTMSFANSECRGAYLNIVAGSFGFATVGGTVLVSQLAARGFTIGKAVKIGLDTANVINVGNSLAAVANSSYEIVNNLIEDKNVSALSVLQLSASILFFHNAVVNFKTANVIIEEAQTSSLNNFKESLRSNRHRKAFNKLLKETIRQTGNVERGRGEVISSLSKITTKDETFAFLTRNNKRFNEYGIKFAAKNGRITLNGMAIDISNLKLQLSDLKSFFSDLPPVPKQTVAQVKSSTVQIGKILKSTVTIQTVKVVGECVRLYLDGKSAAEISINLLQHFQPVIQSKILRVTMGFFKTIPYANWMKVCFDNFSEIHTHPVFVVVHLVIKFVHSLVLEHKSAYLKRNGPSKNYNNIEKTLYWVDQIMNLFVKGSNISGFLMQKFISWVFSLVINNVKRMESKKPIKNGAQKKACKVCNGFYYDNS